MFKPAGGRNKAAAPDPTKQARARAAVVPGGRSVACHTAAAHGEVASDPAASTAVSPLQQDRHTTLSGLLLRAEAAPDPLERMLAVCRCRRLLQHAGGRLACGWANMWLVDECCIQAVRTPHGYYNHSSSPVDAGLCCTPPQTCCAQGAALATRPPLF